MGTISEQKLKAPYENRKNLLRHSYVNKAREVAQAIKRGVNINEDAYYSRLKEEIRLEAMEDRKMLKGDYVIMCYEIVYQEVERITEMRNSVDQATIEEQYKRILDLLARLEQMELAYEQLLKKHLILQLQNISLRKSLVEQKDAKAKNKGGTTNVNISEASSSTAKPKATVMETEEFNRWELGRRLRVTEAHVRKLFAHHHSKGEDKLSVTAFCERHRITRNHYYRIIKANVKIVEDKEWLEGISLDEYYKANPEELAKKVRAELEREKLEAEIAKANGQSVEQVKATREMFSYENIKKTHNELQSANKVKNQ